MLREALWNLLSRVYTKGLAIQTDSARTSGHLVAAAASLGLITTWTPGGFGRTWRLTEAGFRFLTEGDDE